MKIESLNVGLPREVLWQGKQVVTSIFKDGVNERRWVGLLNIQGDQQADLRVHGGPDKAVYAYPTEHYAYWKAALPTFDLPFGMFGENLTVSGGLREDLVRVGDRFRIGTAELMAVQPRMPCFKLGIRFGTPDIVRKFLSAGRPGIYFRVIQEGEVGPGDRVELISPSDSDVTVLELVGLLTGRDNRALLDRALRAEALPEGLRQWLQRDR